MSIVTSDVRIGKDVDTCLEKIAEVNQRWMDACLAPCKITRAVTILHLHLTGHMQEQCSVPHPTTTKER